MVRVLTYTLFTYMLISFFMWVMGFLYVITTQSPVPHVPAWLWPATFPGALMGFVIGAIDGGSE
jgi:hypothetical protein